MPPKKGKGKKGKAAKAAASASGAAGAGAGAGAGGAAAPALSAELPNKEQGLYRAALKAYETKQYKKALKNAEAVLKKYPTHGESVSVKGLVLNAMGKKEEAYELVREGCRLNMRSHVTWHIYGILHRTDSHYEQAAKCYANALKIDAENAAIMKDLANLNTQTRNIAGLSATRRKLITLQPKIAANWFGFAVSHHLLGNYDMAFSVLSRWESTLERDGPATYESNELVMYRAMILEDKGDYAALREFLESNVSSIVNRRDYDETYARVLVANGALAEALVIYRQLLTVNPENYIYHRGVQCCTLGTPELIGTHADRATRLPSSLLDLSESQVEVLLTLYTDLAAAQPKCRAHFKIPLTFLPAAHPAFRPRLDQYLRHGLRKGIPSLFSDVKVLYSHPGKPEVLEELIERYVAATRTNELLPSVTPADPPEEGSEPPSTFLFALLLSAKHFDRVGRRDDALERLDEAIQQNPLAVDLYTFKARVLKRQGRLHAAVDTVDYGRKLDLADRYVNTKTTKYLCRVDRTKDAFDTIALFAREDSDPVVNLKYLQVSWFNLEMAASYLRQRQVGQALKQYKQVEKYYLEFKEDEFDFHAYCLRRPTLQAYYRFLKWQDRLPGYHAFVSALKGLIKGYLLLHDDPSVAEDGVERDPTDAELAEMSAADRKKAKQAMRKRKKKEEEEAKAAEKAKAASGNKTKTPVDDDPLGYKLTQVDDALKEAHSFALKLENGAGSDLEALGLLFDVAVRRSKFVQALRWVTEARKHHPQSAEVLRMTVRLLRAREELASSADSSSSSSSPVVIRLLDEFAASALPSGASLNSFLDSQLTEHPSSFSHRLAVADMKVLLDASSVDAAVALVDPVAVKPTLEEAQDGHTLLVRLVGGVEHVAVKEYAAKCTELFPKSDVFDKVEVVPEGTGMSACEEVEVEDAAGAGAGAGAGADA